uniref:Uncharacterized protein n=1 Tax=Octopus bimaculoides TaxID=37653 RepID=A0A0L8I598_OCTBM
MFRIGVVLTLLVILGLTNGRVLRQQAVQLQQSEMDFNFTASNPLRLKRASEKKFKFEFRVRRRKNKPGVVVLRIRNGNRNKVPRRRQCPKHPTSPAPLT